MRYAVTFNNGHFPDFFSSEQAAKLWATKIMMAYPGQDIAATVSKRDRDSREFRVVSYKHSGGAWYRM